jgi:hypothetical protein
MASPRSQFGGAKIGAKGEYTYMGLDKEKPTEPFRVLPAMHSLAAEGIWMQWLSQHYGFKGLSQDKTKQVPRPFLCIEEKDYNTDMITVSCPECRDMDRREQMIKDREATLINEAKAKGILEQSAIERYCAPLLKPMKDWFEFDGGGHSLSGNYFLNAVTLSGKLVVVKLGFKAGKVLEAKIKDLRAKGIEPITDFDKGVYFVMKRSGAGSTASFEATVYQEEIAPDTFKTKMAPLSDETLEKALKNLPDLSKIARKLTAAQIQLLVESSGDPEEVDTIFNMSQRREASPSSLPPAQEAPTPAQAPAQAPVAPIPAQAAPAPTPAAAAPVVPPETIQKVAAEDDEVAKLMAQLEAAKAAKAAKAAAASQATAPAPAGIPNPMDPNLPPADFAKLFPAKLPPR